MHRAESDSAQDRLLLPGLLLGIGVGGFVDGIVLHQILQWHHLLSSHGDYPPSTIGGLETNVLWDGLFHAFTWVATVAGIVLLWRAGASSNGLRLSGRALAGAAALGWGLFNLIEGLINHHLLTLHHVRHSGADALPYDIAFLVFGVILVGGGYWLLTTASPAADRDPHRRSIPDSSIDRV